MEQPPTQDDSSNASITPRQSSFKGRLNMGSFMFHTDTSPTRQRATPRRSARLSSNGSSTARLTKPSPDNQASASSLRKRKADVLSDSSPPGADNTTTPADSPTASPSTTPKNKKRSRPKSGYVPPSVYAHLPALPDALAPNLLVLFCGLNPGLRTARTGHAYNHPSNLFWKLAHASGVLPARCAATEDRSLPARFRLGLTNIVARPSRSGAELSRAEMDAGVGALERKVCRWRPEVVCVVGKGIWESVCRVRARARATAAKGFSSSSSASKLGGFRYGWQDEGENMGVGAVGDAERVEGVVYDEGWKGARVFVASSTSGLAASLRPEEKEKIWRELGVWVEARRAGKKTEPGDGTAGSYSK